MIILMLITTCAYSVMFIMLMTVICNNMVCVICITKYCIKVTVLICVKCIIVVVIVLSSCLCFQEKWEVLQGIRLLGTTFWCGLSNHQAATAQMHLVGQANCRVPTPLRSNKYY